MHRSINPMRIFSAIAWDPFSILFGLHHIYSGNKRLALLHGSVGATDIILWIVFGVIYNNFEETCCYSSGTSSAVIKHGGPCNSGAGLSYDHAGCAVWPAHLHGVLYAALTMLFACIIFWYATYDQYKSAISDTVMEIAMHRIAEEDAFADDIQYEQFIGTVEWFPFVGIILGLHILYSHGIEVFIMRCILVAATIVSWIGATEKSRQNIAYGCYFWTKLWYEMGMYGLCTDKTSVAYGMSDSGRVSQLWTSTKWWWVATAVSTGCFLILFILTKFGVFAWKKWIIVPNTRRYVLAMRRYATATRYTYQTRGVEYCNRAFVGHAWMAEFCGKPA